MLDRRKFEFQAPLNERGAVIVIVALMAVVLFAFVALAIDSSMVATSKAQQRYTAEKMGLGALRAFVGADKALSDSEKLQVALDRAQALANDAGNILLTDPFLKIPGQTKELGTGISGTPNDGLVIPGKWYFRAEGVDCSKDPSPCPCKSGAPATPCFQPYDSIGDFTTYGQPNSFQVQLHLRSDSPIRTIFGSVVGGEYLYINSEATSAIAPTRGVFALDLSRSMAFGTHVPYEVTNKDILRWSDEAAYQYKGDACPNPGYCNAPGSCRFFGGKPGVTDTLNDPSDAYGLFDAIWNYTDHPILKRKRVNRPAVNSADTTPGGGSGSVQQYNAHFRDDYQCYNVTFKDGPNNAEVTAPFFVDTYKCPDALNPKACPAVPYTPEAIGYDGPEPLTSALYGIHEALDLFEKRAVPGTKIGLVGFDQTPDIDIRKFQPAAPGDADYTVMEDITKVDGEDAATFSKRYGEHMFFPRPDQLTNIPRALEKAAFMLADANNDGKIDSTDGSAAANAENFIALITDGGTNCLMDGTCDPSDTGLLNSIDAANAFVDSNLVPQKIKLHLIMLGASNRPHTLLRKSSKNSDACMDETEAREANPPLDFVDFATGSLPSYDALQNSMKAVPTKFDFTTNRFYEMARKTDGFWFPIRKPCTFSSVADCQAGKLVKLLDTKCAATTDKVLSEPGITDGAGRLICDPYCYSVRKQIKDAVEKIAGRSPYVLVK